ncbi:MAG: hypothetical protein ISS02_01615 [Candidatus Portnoybacteria bacterium]|nr:hypothetical protein [Candidatus Portnoybacteria bacterium]
MSTNRITQSVIVGLATLVATISWSGLRNVLFENGNWIWPSLGFLILLVFLSLAWLLAESKPILLVTLVIVLVSFLLSFSFRLEYLAILFVAFLLFYFGSLRAIEEKKSRVKIQTFRILKRGLPYVLTALSLVIASAYYFSPLALKGQDQIEISRSLFNIAIKPSIQLSKTFGISLLEEEKIEDVIYQTLNQEINKRSNPYKEYFPIGLSLGIFFSIKALSIPFMWIVIVLSMLIFKILVSLGAVKIQERSVLKEVIEV